MPDNVAVLESPCTGCGACALICPSKAINIALDKEGFYAVSLNQKLCTNCGLCKTVCIKNGIHNVSKITDGTVFAAQSADKKTVKESSSGGIAYELTRYAISQNIKVAGVIYNYQKDRAETVIADSYNDAEKFKGSKYLQSYTVSAFKQIINDLETDGTCKFLVFGTPCQIYGLANVLEIKHLRDRVILVDLFCHGVPSYFVWDKYLDSLRKKSSVNKLSEVSFRDKSIGWHDFVIKTTFADKQIKETSEASLFYHAFFDNVLFSKACFNCKVRQTYSKADIRLGDYWGKRYQSNEDGISAVLIMSSRGKQFADCLKDFVVHLESGPVEEILKAQSVHDYPTYIYRDSAFSNLKNGLSLESTIANYRKYFPFKKKIKLKIKEATALLPDGLRSNIRKIYKKL